RFEKWVNKTDRSVHWRTRAKSNTVSVYGKNAEGLSKIQHPEDLNQIFCWLPDYQYDRLGNVIQYVYEKENDDNVNPYSSFESGRIKQFNETGFAQRYLKKIRYGNSKPIQPDQSLPA